MAVTKQDLQDLIINAVSEQVLQSGVSESSVSNAIKEVADHYVSVNSQMIQDSILDYAKENLTTPTVIEKVQLDGSKKPQLAHKQFDDLIKLISAKLPVLLVGMPGTGKTSACELASEALDLDFHTISVGIQTTKTDILGFTDANGNYQATGFRKAFENGGIFLMDEIDAGNPNVLIIINSAISNGFCTFPDGIVKAHPDFRFVATANTFGTGADSRFIGRNQLDEATLDRFITLDFEIDETLEDVISDNPDWVGKVRHLRERVKYDNRDILVSPRVSIYGARLIAAGFDMRKAAEMTILKGKDDDTKQYIINEMNI